MQRKALWRIACHPGERRRACSAEAQSKHIHAGSFNGARRCDRSRISAVLLALRPANEQQHELLCNTRATCWAAERL